MKSHAYHTDKGITSALAWSNLRAELFNSKLLRPETPESGRLVFLGLPGSE
jgi:hypothetical protein